MTITVYYTEVANNATQINMEKSCYYSFIESLSSKIDNPEVIDLYLKDITVLEKKPQSSEAVPNYDYVVIVNTTFLNSEPLNTFIDWKKKKGINIGVVDWTTLPNLADNIGNDNQNALNSQSIIDNAAKIRMHLKSINKNGGCKFVLLIGNSSLLPVREYFANHPNNPSFTITDKYYADYNSDYAVDYDNNFGEITDINNSFGDNVDLEFEAYIGRIPCANIDEFSIWVNKLLVYELNPGNGDASYLNKFIMTMADEPQSYIKQSEEISNNLSIFNPFVEFVEYPTIEAPSSPTGEQIIQSFNTSPSGWWTWDNHGDVH